MATKGKIIAVVGNSGVGKTTLAHRLCAGGPFMAGAEQHEERPFQRLFSGELRRYALANQTDYLLYRAEQEWAIRESGKIGVLDGGLDLDFRVFTRLFHTRGYLEEREYALCGRLYAFIRGMLPPPDVIVWMRAPLRVVSRRYLARRRGLAIATVDDLPQMEALLEEWLGAERKSTIIQMDASREDPCYADAVGPLIHELLSVLWTGGVGSETNAA